MTNSKVKEKDIKLENLIPAKDWGHIRKLKLKSQTEITVSIYKEHPVCLPLLSTLSHPPPLLLLPSLSQQKQPCLLLLLILLNKEKKDEDLYDDPFLLNVVNNHHIVQLINPSVVCLSKSNNYMERTV